MALFNYATKEITLKIVYYGPGLSGKTTNIEYLHSTLDQAKKGKLLSLSTETDRTLFFDFLPVEIGKIKDFSVRFQLYTVPGQVRYNATRKLVLKGADAVVFIADSQQAMKESNIESLENMRENLIANDLNPDDIPVTFQYNKRDLPNVLSVEEMNKQLNPLGYKYFQAVAITGKGVEDTFQSVSKELLKHIVKKHRIDVQSKDISGEAPEKASPPPSGKRLQPSSPFQESEKIQMTAPSNSSFELVGSGDEEISVEQVEGLQNQDELREESTQKQFKPQPDAARKSSSPPPPFWAEKEGRKSDSQPSDDDSSLESIYKTFMETEKQNIPPRREDAYEDRASQKGKKGSDESDSFKSFRESLKSPAKEDAKAEEKPLLPKKDIFESLSEPLTNERAPSPGKPGTYEKPEVFESSPSSAGDSSLSAAQNIILDEINALSRTIRKLNDSLTSLKSEMSLVTKKMDEMEQQVSSLQGSSTEIAEVLKKGKAGLSDDLIQSIISLKTTIEKAKKKKFWILFS